MAQGNLKRHCETTECRDLCKVHRCCCCRCGDVVATDVVLLMGVGLESSFVDNVFCVLFPFVEVFRSNLRTMGPQWCDLSDMLRSSHGLPASNHRRIQRGCKIAPTRTWNQSTEGSQRTARPTLAGQCNSANSNFLNVFQDRGPQLDMHQAVQQRVPHVI